ncbi:MAG: OmpA family protein [Cytophagaceae bacterium]|nr:OmpA family protein [Cytophagaceae bacterium]
MKIKHCFFITAFTLTGSIAFAQTAEMKFTTQPENLGQNVNTGYSDFKPIVTPDGKTVYFIRRDFPRNVGGGSDDIWYTKYINGEWTVAQNMGSPLNTASVNAVSAISPDGNSMLVMSAYNYFDGTISAGVSMSYRDKKGWVFPKKQEVKDWVNLNEHVDYYLTNDQQLMLVSAERKKKENFGGQDIYFCKKTGDNAWTVPVNLGPVINTAGDEFGAFLAADGKTLFFASDGHVGLGSADIWMSKRLDDSWTNWSPIVNLGPPINTADWDAYFTIPASGDYAYFSSSNNSFGNEDVFRIKMPEAAKPDAVVLVKGKVLDKETGLPVKGVVTYETLPSGKIAGTARSEPAEGNYSIVLPKGYNYGFIAESEGYYAINENIDLFALDAYKEVERNIYMAPLTVGAVIRLNNIFFEFGKAVLKEESYPELDRVVKLLIANPTITLEIAGHTDNVGSDEANQTLSADRAKAVVDYLISKGIGKKALSSKGYGETVPVGDNITEEGRQLNRRVEFKILNK